MRSSLISLLAVVGAAVATTDMPAAGYVSQIDDGQIQAPTDTPAAAAPSFYTAPVEHMPAPAPPHTPVSGVPPVSSGVPPVYPAGNTTVPAASTAAPTATIVTASAADTSITASAEDATDTSSANSGAIASVSFGAVCAGLLAIFA